MLTCKKKQKISRKWWQKGETDNFQVLCKKSACWGKKPGYLRVSQDQQYCTEELKTRLLNTTLGVAWLPQSIQHKLIQFGLFPITDHIQQTLTLKLRMFLADARWWPTTNSFVTPGKLTQFDCFPPDNTHKKVSPFWLGKSMPFYPKQCRTLKNETESRKMKLNWLTGEQWKHNEIK